MGDLMCNIDIFKKLGFVSSNQWIFYDESFEKFFNFFADNISDVNILTEHEVLERDELVQRQLYLDAPERYEQMQQLERDHPGLLAYTEQDVGQLTTSVSRIVQTEDAFSVLVEDMRCTKNQINYRLSKLEDSVNILISTDKDLLALCQSKAKQLEELQRDNHKLCAEATKCFKQIQSPPLFMHQLPIDQYFLKCDSFMQYFSLYMKENFKIQEFIELESNPTDTQDFSAKLEKLARSIEYYTLEHRKELVKSKATQSLIDLLDLTHIHIISPADMERETHELQLVNEHHLKSTYETLMHDLTMHVHQHTRQHMELILYENTKEKLNRALQRHENDKRLTRIISDALSNAELIWMAMQLDSEKKRNRCDTTEQLGAEAEACQRRIRTMRGLQLTVSQSGACAALIEEIADQLSQHTGQKVRSEVKACLYEYEKFGRLLNYALQNVLTKKVLAGTLERLQELQRMEQQLRPLVYDSPVKAPMFEHVRFLMPIFNAKVSQQYIEKTLRNLRVQFQENVTEKMSKHKYWRYSQLLWIWFLTEPRRVLMAIEEVRKAAGRVPALTEMKPIGGIKRK